MFVFRTKTELEALAQEEWAALRERLRRRLAQPFDLVVSGANTLFGFASIASKTVAARLWLVPEILDGLNAFNDDDLVLRVEASAELSLDVKFATGAGAAMKGLWRVDLEVRKATLDKAVRALLAMSARVAGPRSRLAALLVAAAQLRRLLVPGARQVALAVRDRAAALCLEARIRSRHSATGNPDGLTGGDLSIATAQSAGGKLFYDGTKICEVSNASFSYGGVAKKHSFTATLQVTDIPVGQPFPVDLVNDKRLPFSIKIAAVSTTVKFDPIVINPTTGATVQGVTLAHELKGIRIAAIDDPTLFIVLDASFETRSSPAAASAPSSPS